MGETFAETRMRVEAQRAHLSDTGERLKARARRAVDIKGKFRENPVLFAGLAAGAVFLAVGGPIRVARMARRRLRPTPPERAYDALPGGLQSWVDTLSDRLGPRAEDARDALSRELIRWRHDPVKSKKLSKEMAERLVEGPPGPSRAGWKAFEAAAAIITAALARKAVERFLSGEPSSGSPTKDAASTAAGGPAGGDGREQPDREPTGARRNR